MLPTALWEIPVVRLCLEFLFLSPPHTRASTGASIGAATPPNCKIAKFSESPSPQHSRIPKIHQTPMSSYYRESFVLLSSPIDPLVLNTTSKRLHTKCISGRGWHERRKLYMKHKKEMSFCFVCCFGLVRRLLRLQSSEKACDEGPYVHIPG